MLCRLAKPLGKALITHGSSPFEANKLRDVTLTLHKAHALHTSRAFCGAHVNHVKGRGTDLCLRWSSSCTCTCDWTHRGRRTTVSACVCSGQSGGGRGHVVTYQSSSDYALHMTKRGLIGNVCFPRLFNRYFYSRAMQTRASSTAAKPRESSEEQPPRASHAGDEKPLKEPSSPPDNPEPAPDGGKPNKTQQLKKVFKEYGAVGVSFHICMSLMSLGMFYLLVSSGIDMGALLCKVGFSESVVQSKMAAGTSTFVLAYAIHKLFAPVRISITLVSVPLIVRHFRKIGLFKAPPTAP